MAGAGQLLAESSGQGHNRHPRHSMPVSGYHLTYLCLFTLCAQMSTGRARVPRANGCAPKWALSCVVIMEMIKPQGPRRDCRPNDETVTCARFVLDYTQRAVECHNGGARTVSIHICALLNVAHCVSHSGPVVVLLLLLVYDTARDEIEDAPGLQATRTTWQQMVPRPIVSYLSVCPAGPRFLSQSEPTNKLANWCKAPLFIQSLNRSLALLIYLFLFCALNGSTPFARSSRVNLIYAFVSRTPTRFEAG